MRHIKQIVCISLIFTMSMSMNFAVAKTLNEQQSDNKSEQANQESKSNELQKGIEEYQAQIKDLDSKIQSEEKELKNIQSQIAEYDKQIADKQRALELEDIKLNGQDDLFKARLRTIYENGTTSFWDVIMSSKSISEFLSKYYIVTQMVEYDKQIMDSIGDQKDYIDTIKSELETSKAAREKASNEQQLKVKTLESSKADKNSLMNKVKSDKSTVDKRIKQLEDENAILTKKIQEEIKKQEEESNNNNNNNNNNNQGGNNSGPSYDGGKFAWPVPGFTRISSPYGYRTSPAGFHNGIDIAQYGQIAGKPIVAATDGQVIFAAYGMSGSGYGGYGNVVAIYHGDGLTTMYAHQERVAVSKGQHVTKGQLIGYVGNSGWSEGYHLHFEVRVNGKAVNPMSYFK